MNNVLEILEKLADKLKEKSVNAQTKDAILAYQDAFELLKNEIEIITEEIEKKEKETYEKQMEKFDIYHANYEVLKKRGHIQKPNDIHRYLSDYSTGKKNSEEVFNCFSKEYKENLLNRIIADKEMIEQLVAYRYGFEYITYLKGHDGIDKNSNVYEIKNKKFLKKNKRLSPDIIFDRISPITLRKMEEGRPLIIFNITDNGKLLLEMKIEFTDKLIYLYKKKVEELKNSKTSGFAIPFSDYKDSIKEITYVNKKIFDYHIQKQLLDYIETVPVSQIF